MDLLIKTCVASAQIAGLKLKKIKQVVGRDSEAQRQVNKFYIS